MQGVLQYREKKYELALDFFERALAIFQEDHQEDHYELIEQNPLNCSKEYQRAISIEYCAQTKRVLGRQEEAERGYELALEAFRKVAKGDEHFDIARILREQGIIWGEKGEYKKAIENVKAAIEMQKRVYGQRFSSQPTVGATYRVLGDLLIKIQAFKEADHAFEKAIEINQQIYQTTVHPYLMYLYEKRAEVLEAQGRKRLAKKMKKRSQAIKKGLLDG